MQKERIDAGVTSQRTVLWYDYETSGRDPALDRPIQVGWLRTSLTNEPIGDATSRYVRLPDDVLPSPGALLVHQIVPEVHQKQGMSEAELAALLSELMTPKTWVAGYNNRRFDDRFTQHVLYRGLRDPYRWQYAEGRGRFDLYPVVLAYYALRPGAIRWPEDADGTPRFKLDRLGPINQLDRGLRAHDAAADVTVTARLAGLLAAHDPDVYADAMLRADKQAVMSLIRAYGSDEGVYEISSFVGLGRGYLRPLWIPFRLGPDGDFVGFDLAQDPTQVTEILRIQATSTADLKTRRRALGEAGITLIRANSQPMLWPRSRILSDPVVRLPEGHQPDLESRHLAEWQAVMGSAAFKTLYAMILDALRPDAGDDMLNPDVDCQLYSGHFYDEADRLFLQDCPYLDPVALATWSPPWTDSRLPELVFRYRARNFPRSLSPAEWRRWQGIRREKLLRPESPGVTLASIQGELAALMGSSALESHQFDQLQAYAHWLENQPPI